MSTDGFTDHVVDRRPRVLFLAHRLPRALDSGWTIRTTSMLTCLTRLGDVDIIDVRRGEAVRAGGGAELEQMREGEQAAPATVIGSSSCGHQSSHTSGFRRRSLTMTGLARNERACRRLRNLTERYDVAWLENIYTAQYAELASANAARTILNTHNVESLLEAQCFRQTPIGAAKARSALRWANIRWAEKRYLPYADTVIAASEPDATAYRRWLGEQRVRLVPNSVDTGPYALLRRRPVGPSLLFAGRLRYFPNRNGLRWFLSDVWPVLRSLVPEIRIVIVGDIDEQDVDELGAPAVEFRGHVPSVAPYLETAAASICPVREGSGTRLKILEAMAAGVPVVSTRKGAEGLEVTSERHLLIADTPRDFAAAVQKVLVDDALARRLVANAKALVEARYSWHATQDQLRQLVCDGVRERRV